MNAKRPHATKLKKRIAQKIFFSHSFRMNYVPL